MSVVMDGFDGDDFIVTDDLIAVDEFGDPLAEVVMTEVHSFDAEGNEVVEYAFGYEEYI